jgi:hypothetical protein
LETVHLQWHANESDTLLDKIIALDVTYPQSGAEMIVKQMAGPIFHIYQEVVTGAGTTQGDTYHGI